MQLTSTDSSLWDEVSYAWKDEPSAFMIRLGAFFETNSP